MASSELLEIDTKEMCLLCYDSCVKGDGDETLISKSASSLTGFKQLLRYLNVNTKELFNCSTQFLQWMDISNEIDVQITLCGKCTSVTEEFDKLYKQYELIQFQFDKCVASLHQSMKSGDESDERVQDFKRQMRPNKSVDLINASIAVNLRTQTFNRCILKLQNAVPRVAVQNRLTPVHNIKKESRNRTLNTSLSPSFSPSSTLGKHDHVEKPIKIVAVTSQNTSDNQLQNLFANDEENDPPVPNEVNEPFEHLDSLLEIVMDESADEVPIQIPPPNRSCKSYLNHLYKPKLQMNLASNKTPSLTCEICKMTFINRKTIRRHRVFLHPEYLLSKSCAIDLPLPQFKLKLNAILQRLYSISVRSDGSSGLQCCYCLNELRWKSDYKYHLVTQHPNELVSEITQTCAYASVDKPSTSTNRLLDNDKPSTSTELLLYKPLIKRTNTQVRHRFPKTITSRFKINSKYPNLYPCKYCPYTSNQSGNLRYHVLDLHTEEMVLPHLNPGSCKIKCRQATEAILNGLKSMGGICPKCSSHLTQSTGLRRHMLGQHFDEFVQDVKSILSQAVDDGEFQEEIHEPVIDYINQDDGLEVGENMGEEEYQEEIPVEIEFGTENVKVEPMATDSGQWDPLEVDIDLSN